jgi:two-component system, cell cycle response regulator DivK
MVFKPTSVHTGSTITTMEVEPQRLHVLVVEDDYINAYVLREHLSKTCRCIHASNADEAYDAFIYHSIDLVLMDINLGRHSPDGVAILQELRSRPGTAGLPIYAVTGYAMNGDENHFLAQGFNRYVPKPVNLRGLTSIIRSDFPARMPERHA